MLLYGQQHPLERTSTHYTQNKVCTKNQALSEDSRVTRIIEKYQSLTGWIYKEKSIPYYEYSGISSSKKNVSRINQHTYAFFLS